MEARVIFLTTQNLKSGDLSRVGGELLTGVTTDAITPIPDVLVTDREIMRQKVFGGLEGWGDRVLGGGEYEVLVAGQSFGIGSSRENSAEQLALNGIRVVVSRSFGSIMLDNLVNQGVIPVTSFDLLGRMMAGEEPSFKELTEGLSEVQQRVLFWGGLPGYVKAIWSGEETKPQVNYELRDCGPQTAVEKMMSKSVSGLVMAGDSMVVKVDELVGYDVFAAHALAVVEREFGGRVTMNPRRVHFFNDHFRGERGVGAREVLRTYWNGNPESFPGTDGVYMKAMVRRLTPGSRVIGMDSHSPEMAVVPGVWPTAVGYTPFGCALATEGLLAYTVPETLKFELGDELPPWCDIKDAIWWITRQYFSGSDGNGKIFEIGGGGYAGLMHHEAAKVCNAVTEWGGKEAVVVELNPDVVSYLRRHGSIPDTMSDAELEMLVVSLKGDEDAEYAVEVTVDLSQVEPAVVGPHSHKRVILLSELDSQLVMDRVVFVSCGGTSILDLAVLCEVLEEGGGRCLPVGIHLADPLTRQRAIELSLLQKLVGLGVKISEEHSCGTCMGEGEFVVRAGERVLSTSNRNYPGRMGDPEAEVYLSSAPVAAVTAVLGRIPIIDELTQYTQAIQRAKKLVLE